MTWARLMKRVMVIGGSGCGKSTLARIIGEITGLPVINIDPFYFHTNWVMRPRAETQGLVRQAALEDEWIIEGNNSETFVDRLARADTMIFIDLPVWVRLWRVICRSIQYWGQTRPDMAPDCPERLNRVILGLVINYRRAGRPRALTAMETAPEAVSIVHLKTRRQVRGYIEKLSQNG